MLENFIYSETKDLFLIDLGAGRISEDAIVFIEDTREIYTHGAYYDGSKIDLNNLEESLKNFVLENLNKTVQTIDLVKGFTWVSFYVKTSLEEVQKALGDKGVSIQTSNDGTGNTNLFSVYDPSTGFWEQNFPEFDFSLMYQIEVLEPFTIKLVGELLNPKDFLITLNPGSNYISYPSNQILDCKDALMNIPEPQEGDVFKSSSSFLEFAFGEWRGASWPLSPGQGYIYKSNSDSIKKFYFPTESDFTLKKAKEYTDFKISTFKAQKVTQKIHLNRGWNWVSFYVDITLEDLQAALGPSGVSIKHALSGLFSNNVEGVWAGNLKTLDLTTSYLVQTSEDCDIYLSGDKFNPSNVSITLNPGPTYIPYLLSQELDINTALQNLKASEGDTIKGYGQNYIATYYPTVGWITAGETFNFVPGQGYLYTSNNQEPVSFTYPNYFYEPFGNVEVVSRLGHSTEKAASQDLVTKELSKKQATLKSGETIKTVNGQSLLGSGDIKVATINYDLNVKAINHRGHSIDTPENTIPAYIRSKEAGFTYVEADVAFTSDNVAVLLHDSTIDRTSNGSGSIKNLTYEKVLQYDFGSWFSSEFEGVKIPTFKEFIILCKRLGLHPYIELKSSDSYTQAQISQIVKEVEDCGMKGKVTYISFNNTFLGYVKNADASARLGLLANPLNSSKISQAKALKTTTNEVFLDAKLSTVTDALISTLMENDQPLEVWTVNTEEEILKMPSYVSGVTSDNLVAGKVLYEAALTYVPPVSSFVPTDSISLSQNSLEFTNKEPLTLVATLDPSNASDPVVWKSSNTAVATVNNGVVTPLADGTCSITATSDGKSASCSVNVAFAKYSVASTLSGCSLSNLTQIITIGDSYVTEVTPDTGYSLKNAQVQVTMGGVDITSSCYSNGIITIENVTGDIAINITCLEVPVYTITRELTGCTSNKDITSIGEGNPYTEQFTLLEGFRFDGASVYITMGGKDITDSSYKEGVLNILEVTGNIFIRIAAEAIPVYSIVRNLVNCTSDKTTSSVYDGDSYTEAIIANDGFTLKGGNISITMGGEDISSSLSNTGVLSIDLVTGDIVINVEAVEVVGAQPIVDLSLTNASDNKIPNLGTGGSAYDATISIPKSSRDSYAVSENGLILNNHAYADTPYGFKASDAFTIIIKARITQKSSNTYQRVFRTDKDYPSLFYSKNSTAIGAKLAGLSGNGFTVHNELGSITGTGGALNTCYLSIYNEDGFDESVMHEYVHTSDGTTIKWYVDGVLMASQPSSPMGESTKIGLGDNNTSQSYYATQIEVSEFKIFNQCLTEEELKSAI